jgi:hypothetical protein
VLELILNKRPCLGLQLSVLLLLLLLLSLLL